MIYEFKVEQLTELERLASQGDIDLFYGDESHVCSEGYVPYGWHFPDELVYVPSQKGYRINLFALISRDNRMHWKTSNTAINADFILDQLEQLSWSITKKTVVVLDNARIHTANIIKKRISYWQKRGLYLFYLPTYSPELNIAEILWRRIKAQQIDPIDYQDNDQLAYSVNRCLAGLGKEWNIKFNAFNIN